MTKDRQEATKWVNDYADILYNFTVRRVNDTHTAKDLVQDTLLAAWKNAEHYNGTASVKTWLFTILKNKIIDHYRKTTRKAGIETVLSGTGMTAFFSGDDHWEENAYPQGWNNDTKDRLETKEFYSVLHGCRNKLKEIQNAVFTLRYLDGMESEEICRALQLSSSNYWILVHRAKVQLRACLEKNWFLQ